MQNYHISDYNLRTNLLSLYVVHGEGGGGGTPIESVFIPEAGVKMHKVK